jgi:hypothetical protein
MLNLRKRVSLTVLVALFALGGSFACRPQKGVHFEVSYSDAAAKGPLDGRLMVMISTDDSNEPRFQIDDSPNTQLIFGVDVNRLTPSEVVVIDSSVLGYPVESLSQVPPGDYIVQGLLHLYETFERADGHIVQLPMDRGEGQQWNRAPGNLLSKPVNVHLDPGRSQVVHIELEDQIAPIPEPEDTKYLKHIKLQSKLLTEFWGRPMSLGATVLLPEGFEEHPDVRYPLVINHGHFNRTMTDFRETPPDPDLAPEYSERFHLEGYNRIEQAHAHQFFKEWTGDGFPRVLVVEIQHANPYYDDSYAVNSENLGPYGDAITYELIPHIEAQFRGIGEGWARFLYGGSTGGWEALAAQVFYPEEYNGCYAACPDPIDFRAYTVVNIYEDANAYYEAGPWKQVERPATRNYLGHVSATLRGVNIRELVLGTKSRSGQQWDIWEAVYSPVNEDGYPKRLWDKRTGEIDQEVAAYWRENYDLRYILERDWDELGPQLEGKINIYCGDMDNYYLNNAVYLMEEFLEKTADPYYGGEVDYGDRAEHCWNGDHERPNAISRLRYHQMFIPRIVDRILETAPPGAERSASTRSVGKILGRR